MSISNKTLNFEMADGWWDEFQFPGVPREGLVCLTNGWWIPHYGKALASHFSCVGWHITEIIASQHSQIFILPFLLAHYLYSQTYFFSTSWNLLLHLLKWIVILSFYISVFTLSLFMVKWQREQQIVLNYACHLRLATGHALMTMTVNHSLCKISVLKCFIC